MVEKNGRRYCNLSLYLVGDVKPDWESVGDVPPDCKEIGPVGNVTLPRFKLETIVIFEHCSFVVQNLLKRCIGEKMVDDMFVKLNPDHVNWDCYLIKTTGKRIGWKKSGFVFFSLNSFFASLLMRYTMWNNNYVMNISKLPRVIINCTCDMEQLFANTWFNYQFTESKNYSIIMQRSIMYSVFYGSHRHHNIF